MDASGLHVNVYVALGIIVSIFALVALLAVHVLNRIEKEMKSSMEAIDKDLTALDARHDELSRNVILNERSLRDSLHDVRTILGTNYVTRTELRDTIDSVKQDMRIGFEDLKSYIKEALGHGR